LSKQVVCPEWMIKMAPVFYYYYIYYYY
jgi:hypothetical protein